MSEQLTVTQLAFGFELAPAGDRRTFQQRLREFGLSTYWAIYDALVSEPPDWERAVWPEHPKRRQHWPRKALYVAWQASPRQARSPKTLDKFAEALGVTRQTIYNWHQKNPQLQALIDRVQLQPLEANLPMVDYVTIYQATDLKGSVPARKLFYDRLQQVRDQQAGGDGLAAGDYAHLTDEELAAELAAWEVVP